MKGLRLIEGDLLPTVAELATPVVGMGVLAIELEVVANLPGIVRFFPRRAAVVAGREEEGPLPTIVVDVAVVLPEEAAVLLTILVKMRWFGPSRCEGIEAVLLPAVLNAEGRGRPGIFPGGIPWPGGGIGPLLDERRGFLFPIIPAFPPVRGALLKLMDALNLESSLAVRGLLGTEAWSTLVGLGWNLAPPFLSTDFDEVLLPVAFFPLASSVFWRFFGGC